MAANKNQSGRSGGRGAALFLVLTLAAAGAGFWYWSARRADGAPSEASSTVRSTLHLETFVLNLGDPGQRSYLRAGVDLGLGRELGRGAESPPVAQIRDTILGVLSESKADDLLTEKGKANLKSDLLRALQQKVPAQKVEEVYFTELLIQR